tara:strand:+ start:1899 stop:2138 length:240 start_codon:yes stop_codon:yes gene_type:complete
MNISKKLRAYHSLFYYNSSTIAGVVLMASTIAFQAIVRVRIPSPAPRIYSKRYKKSRHFSLLLRPRGYECEDIQRPLYV